MITTTPRYYVNNKELLEQIKLSKLSYCSFRNRAEDSQYDIIVRGLDEITADTIELATKTRADRLGVEITDVHLCDLVFRVMTTEHVPPAPPKPPKNPPKQQDLAALFDFESEEVIIDEIEPSKKHIRTIFPPFHHYRLTGDSDYLLVGKSHWQGDLENGEFCQKHGKITEKLATMFLMMVNRYSSRGNWRSYTYLEEMKGNAIISLCAGGLQFDESKSSNPFSFYTTVITNAFTGYLLIERKNQNIRDDLLEMNGLNPSFTRQYANSYNFADKHGPVIIINSTSSELISKDNE